MILVAAAAFEHSLRFADIGIDHIEKSVDGRREAVPGVILGQRRDAGFEIAAGRAAANR
jgi:hypothetical protein